MDGTKEYIRELKDYITYLEDIVLIQHDRIETESLTREVNNLYNLIVKERKEKLNA